MYFILFAVFVGVPIIEICFFIFIGGEIGLVWTLITIILSAVIGALILQRNGMRAISRFRDQIHHGQLKLGEAFDGLCLLLAGAFLLTPGFFTDVVGLLISIPLIRNLLRTNISRRVAHSGHFYFSDTTKTDTARHAPDNGMANDRNIGPIIDGEFQNLTDKIKLETEKTKVEPVVRRIDK